MPLKDSEANKKYRQQYYQKNKEREKKQSKDYYQNHKEELQKWSHKYYHNHQQEYLRNIKKKHELLKGEIIELLGGKCANPYNLPHPDWCNSLECLQIDHVHGNGPKERKQFKSPWTLYLYILEKIKAGSKDYQLLCANCNWIKRHKNGENPYGKIMDVH